MRRFNAQTKPTPSPAVNYRSGLAKEYPESAPVFWTCCPPPRVSNRIVQHIRAGSDGSPASECAPPCEAWRSSVSRELFGLHGVIAYISRLRAHCREIIFLSLETLASDTRDLKEASQSFRG